MRNLLTRLAVCVTDWRFYHDLKRLEAIHMTYKLMKRIIEKGSYDYESTLLKLDVFLMADRITVEEYQELVELMGGGAE